MTDLARLQFAVALLVGLGATITDLRRRTIPNFYPVVALLSGCLLQGWSGGWRGAWEALGGAVAGFLVFFVFYLLGGMGGGDVKLMAGFGALVGVSRLTVFAFWTALVGGILALLVVGIARRGKGAHARPHSIPYAPAIAAGVCLALISA